MPKTAQIRAAIYDLDGVLLDTEPLYTRVTQEIVAEYGKVFDWSVKRHMIGRPSLEAAGYLVDALSLPMSPADYLDRRRDRLAELFRDTPAVEGARDFTARLAARGLGQAIATSSELELYDIKAAGHRDWFEVFGAVVTGDHSEVARGKPAPDNFLVAARELGAAPGPPVCGWSLFPTPRCRVRPTELPTSWSMVLAISSWSVWVCRPQPTTPSETRACICSWSRPSSPRTSLLCCPASAASGRARPGVRDSRGAGPGAKLSPADGTKVPRALLCL